MPNQAWIVANPISGRQNKKIIVNLLEINLREKAWEVKVEWTESAEHARGISLALVNGAVDWVIVVGGDGTLNAVATGLIGKQIPLSVFPAGSGNGWTKNFLPLKGYGRKQIDAWVERLLAEQASFVDVGTIGDAYFFNVASLGFIAEVADDFHQLTKRGFWAYCKRLPHTLYRLKTASYRGSENLFQAAQSSGVFQFLNFKGKERPASALEVKMPSGQFEIAMEKELTAQALEEYPAINAKNFANADYTMVAFTAANIDFFLGKSYGGFMRVNPNFDLTSGKLSVFICNLTGDFFHSPKGNSFWSKLRGFLLPLVAIKLLTLRYLFGWFRQNPFILEEQVKEVVLEPLKPGKMLIQYDGETKWLDAGRLEIKVLPKALLIRMG